MLCHFQIALNLLKAAILSSILWLYWLWGDADTKGGSRYVQVGSIWKCGFCMILRRDRRMCFLNVRGCDAFHGSELGTVPK